MLEATANPPPVALNDKYLKTTGRIFITGTQALIRLMLMQYQRDQAAGLNTAGFVSGYRGSPLGAVDQQFWKARQLTDEHNIRFQPGLNEELAATAVWGTQQVNFFPGSTVDGVFGMWYGKGPGVDRTGDAFRHANLQGTAAHGGVLAIAGDDHISKSSTIAHQTEFAFADLQIPVLNPSNVQEIIDYGLYGYALSRYSGCWVALKVLGDTVDTSATVDVDPQRVQTEEPADFEIPPGGLNGRWQGHQPLVEEQRLKIRLEAVRAWVRANGLDREMLSASQRRLGIVTTGKAWLDVQQAFVNLGIDEATADTLGLSVYKVAMPWPLEPVRIAEFVAGHDEILVVEEKRSLIEQQLKDQLYNAATRPRIVGKTDEFGTELLPTTGELTPAIVADVLAARLKRAGIDVDAVLPAARPSIELASQRNAALASFEPPLTRKATYCSGCPHNSSTKVPEGSRASAGIGCHYMVLWMDRDTDTYTQMGGEGVSWIGQAPYSADKHIFVNLGDGTYFHSGLLAIRAAIAAKVNITYKILYNDAVAMTGGQPLDGQLDVPALAHQVFSEGASKIIVVSDQPELIAQDALPAGTTVHHRSLLDQLQRQLREVEGCSVLIYDQTCAAEKRRRRKRKEYPDPAKRVVINERVCEGCGDCGVQSNCVSIVPTDTAFGRKRQIDQSSCNKDYSCVNGFCPSFVTVEGGQLRKRAALVAADPAQLPVPTVVDTVQQPCNILLTGVGGTGVITIGALLGMAAHVEGKGSSVLDMAGMAQKGGAVFSHIRIGHSPEAISTPNIALAGADLLLGVDLVVASSKQALSKLKRGTSRAILNAQQTITSDFTSNPDWQFPAPSIEQLLGQELGEEAIDWLPANELAVSLLGDSIGANLMMLGYAAQKGLLPVGVAALEQAIALNGVSVEMNTQALRWGRQLAHDPDSVHSQITATKPAPGPQTLEALIEHRASYLTGYQNQALAQRYRSMVDRIRHAESRVEPGSEALTLAVAKNYFKLLAIKDEYEVARLHSDGQFAAQIARQFEGDYTLKFHLAPPLTAKRDAQGKLVKKQFGAWMLVVFKLMAKLRVLRGTALDIFGHTAERKLELQLIKDYEQDLALIIEKLDRDNIRAAVMIAEVPKKIRGYGHVKEANAARAKTERQRLLGQLQTTAAHPTPAQNGT